MLTLRADYTFTIAENDTADQELIRRPKNKASFSAIWQAWKDLRFSATALYTGPWIDGNRDFTIPRLTAPGYTTLNLTADYDIRDNVTLYGRIENLLDHHYQDPVWLWTPAAGLGYMLELRPNFNKIRSKINDLG